MLTKNRVLNYLKQKLEQEEQRQKQNMQAKVWQNNVVNSASRYACVLTCVTTLLLY